MVSLVPKESRRRLLLPLEAFHRPHRFVGALQAEHRGGHWLLSDAIVVKVVVDVDLLVRRGCVGVGGGRRIGVTAQRVPVVALAKRAELEDEAAARTRETRLSGGAT